MEAAVAFLKVTVVPFGYYHIYCGENATTKIQVWLHLSLDFFYISMCCYALTVVYHQCS